ncbi:MAG: hypothetical protein WA970_19085 [Gammaproteobacteria bacterium]
MSSRLAAINASPLIYLARAEHLELLRLAGDELIVPAIVAAEILVREADDPTVRALNDNPWLQQVDAPPPPSEVLLWNLGVGESAVISWALAHPGCRAVIDDLKGRAVR